MTIQINKDTTLCMSLAARPSNFGTRFHNYLYQACVIRRNWTGNPSETGQSFRAKLDSRSEATHGVLVVYS